MFRNFLGVLGTMIENHSCFTKSFMYSSIIGLILWVYFMLVDTKRNAI